MILLPAKSTVCYVWSIWSSGGGLQLCNKHNKNTTEMDMLFFPTGQCVTCGDKVTGANEACQAMGNLYHTKCFVCCSCGELNFPHCNLIMSSVQVQLGFIIV